MRLWPQSLFGRLLLLMSAGLLVAQLAGALLQIWDRQRTLSHTLSHELAQRIAAIYQVVNESEDEGEQLHRAGMLSTPSLRIDIVSEAPPPSAVPAPSMLADLPGHIRERLGQGAEVRTTALPLLERFAFDLHVRLSSGRWLHLRGAAPQGVFALPWNLLFNLGLMLVAVVFLVAMAARSTVRPLTELARAAHGFGRDLHSPPVPETGPSEVREAARAFNAMQTQIRQGIEERERFLAAVSHDIKTPLTRMRLRTEMMADQRLRARFQHDLDDMLQLLDGALDFLRGKSVGEPMQPVDLVALVESLVEDYQDMGAVTLQAPDALQWPCRPKALKRALTNLIDNALKYGGGAHVVLAPATGGVEILVQDEGPGLAPDELTKVFEPFYRVEHSRSRETGGAGLGLAIVRQIAHSHGGEVELCNRSTGGLQARMFLGRDNYVGTTGGIDRSGTRTVSS